MLSPILATIDVYERAHRQGWWYRLWAALRGRSSRLLDLAAVVAESRIYARRAAGLQIVPIRQILGSEGRSDAFDAAFHPLQTHTEVRWRSIARAGLVGATLPPVDLIRVGEIYFVRDGHHRISVARALGQQEIDAVVTVWQLGCSAPVPASHPARATIRRLADLPAVNGMVDCAIKRPDPAPLPSAQNCGCA
ncbi:MAG: hypothetical protein ACJ8CR_23865 [Roseiflexaceae bacterium]